MNPFSRLMRAATGAASRISIRSKLLVMGVVFIVPVIVMSWMTGKRLGAEIAVAETERAGVHFLAPARDVLSAVQLHRGTSQLALAGDQRAGERLAAVAKKVDDALLQIENLAKTHSGLQVAGGVAGLQAKWSGIKSKTGALSAADDFKAHTAVAEEVLAFLGLVGDSSGLILDPEIETFYLMNAAVSQLPKIIELSALTRGLAAGAAARKSVTDDEAARLTMMQHLVAREE